MKAMILAAGRGERMRPLTDACPKPLLAVGGKPLIVWHLERLAAAGFTDVVINHAWLGERIESALGDGRAFGLRITYSPEAPGGLETAGGIATALPHLGEAPFLVINGDVWCDWDPGEATALAARVDGRACRAWLLLVDNPPQHPDGDFHLAAGTPVSAVHADARVNGQRLTFSGIGIYHPGLLASIAPHTRARLAPLLREAMAEDAVIGTRHDGRWVDVGTPARLTALDDDLRASH
ncbi:nucleotidyltransferase family protein [Achromobacter sp. GG226]|uniref:N-acetylmuramate alpha-1-phosphate uridylyltransferase MurU n=1 Tax=Verticiella alkaliphila TaxID=2779529 RepID=UPI001C0C7CB3|nr:nucleotidyltransferase family protein [Verticiella sp. GG226]MBU4612985.1 nucleotidyltransferase family protein [Verticiella sp. GG226]